MSNLSTAVSIVGGQKKLASALNCSQSMVSYWLYKSKKGVPAEYCATIEKLTGVTKEQLRPDIFQNIAQPYQTVNPHNIAGATATTHNPSECEVE